MQQVTKYFRVAEHCFSLCATEEQLAQLTNYAPFLVDEIASTQVFKLRLSDQGIPSAEGWETDYTDRSDDDMPRIEMYHKGDERLFLVSQSREGSIVCAMRCSMDFLEAEISMVHPNYLRFAVDNATMLLYAFSTVDRQTLLFHASVITREGKGCLFLGHSGTGKSTHSRMWLETFGDAVLLNDDNPAVRLWEDGSVRVYGTPWSGKTPCYKNDEAPVAALVQLEQAPENTIAQLRMTQAYPFILASVSGLKVDPKTMDALYESIAGLLERVPVYKLRCLPNHDAAQLCAQTCLS